MARGDEAYERARAATEKAARLEADKQEELRKRQEGKSPGKMSREDVARARRMDDGSGGPVKPKKRFRK